MATISEEAPVTYEQNENGQVDEVISMAAVISSDFPTEKFSNSENESNITENVGNLSTNSVEVAVVAAADTNNVMPVADAVIIGSEKKKKADQNRRYWSTKEEERFFEIWGRENWRLTKNGKNTVHFAQWAEEIRERFQINIKPEEIQAKVNQTRAKFRQVKKQLENDKSATKWRKYDLIERILRNLHRPKDADPIPQEALDNNRDMTEEELREPPPPPARNPTPTSITSNSNQEEAIMNLSTSSEQQLNAEPAAINQVNMPETNMPVGLFNTNNEIFSNQLDDVEIKREEFTTDYNAYQYQEQNHYGHPLQPNQVTDQQIASSQLLELQTPRQLQQQQEQQQMHIHQQQQYQTAPGPTQHYNLMEQTVAYDHSSNSYANNNTQNTSTMLQQHHYGSPASTPSSTPTLTSTPPPNAIYSPQDGFQLNNNQNANNNNNNSMQPPRQLTNTTTNSSSASRKRGRPFNNSMNATSAGSAAATEAIETQYLEEVRKKNTILEQQKDISLKRMQLEERKINLMEVFFPKCLALQEQILQKLNKS